MKHPNRIRERAKAYRLLQSIKHPPAWTRDDLDRVVRRKRREALKEAIEELEYLYEFGKYESDTDLGRGFRDAIDGLREFRRGQR